MKYFRILLSILIFSPTALLADSFPITKPTKQGFSSERLEKIGDLSQRYIEEKKIAGMVNLVARNGKIVYYDAKGSRGLDDPRPLKKDSLFRIYSMTKPITSVALMMLYEKGAFQMKDPVSKFIPELNNLTVMNDAGDIVPAEKTMTMQHLMTHTAGFSYGFNPNDPIDKLYTKAELVKAKDLDDFINRLATLPLRSEPGTIWHYSVAVDVMGLVVERISGIAFDVYLQQEIFDPLGMTDTFFSVPKDKRDRFIPNQVWDAEKGVMTTVVELPEWNYEDVTLFSGGGGLVSTAYDYLRFAEMMRNGGALNGKRLLSANTIDFMTTNHMGSLDNGMYSASSGLGFGLGFQIVTDPVALGLMSSVGEYSWSGAAGTFFWVDPVENIVSITLIQLMASPFPISNELRVLTNQALIQVNQ
ncbi:beta-lactamase family protein [Pseudomonadales bacterium]|nr:beta-lactamase family protein [Pseudomonadales bacterium]